MKINFLTKIEENSGVNFFLLTEESLKENNFLNIDQEKFKAEYCEKLITVINGKLSVIIGLGKEKQLDNKKLEQIGYKILKITNCNKFENITLNFNADDNEILNIIIGMELGNYEFNKYLLPEIKEKKSSKLSTVNVLAKNIKEIENKYKDFLIIKENVFLCRNLVNEPSNVINPDTYSEICEQLTEYGLEVEIFDEEKMSQLGMNAILAVGQGSDCESKFIVLKWKGLKKFSNPIALVGKGVTFDSGGLSLKPSGAMYDMKSDMAGSAVVVSTLKLLAQRKAKVNAVGVIALVENMPSGNSIKPADIVESMSKQTIEILDTDAEGRLILSDSLYYAVTTFNPSIVIDLATLTGACCIALGSVNAGLFTNNDTLANEIVESSKNIGEGIWRMPLGELGSAYDKMMDSDVADVKNISSVRIAGAITAAQFLQRFINKHKKWAHLDIACTSFLTSTEKYGAKNIYTVEDGATGFGVRLLNDLISNYYEEQ